MKKNLFNILLILCTLLMGCKDSLTEDLLGGTESRTIRVGGVVSDDIITIQTRAGEVTDTVHAETVDWLKGALLKGLDITYSNLDANGNHVTNNQHVAILKWLGTIHETSKRGDYTFKYKVGRGDAEWYDNGPHYFEGQYVPEEIRTTTETITATNLITDQHDDADHTYDATSGAASGSIGNYTLLSHYVGMPPKWTTSATVDQVLLPFKHRLARVIAYILIDPDLKDKTGLAPAKLKGYEKDANGKDDPSTTELRFANVQVLEKVQEVAASDGSDAAASLTPQWTMARRVIPHFEAELTQSVNNKQELAVPDDATDAEKTAAKSGFIVYKRNRDEKLFHPREDGWYEAHKDYVKNGPKSAYTQKMYLSVPVYDVIVRPTYKTTDDVMYDEADYYNADKTVNTSAIVELASKENSIEFEMTLNNDLVYTKTFEFDLNANQQTIVYITIDRKRIDYDESKSEQWISTNTTDNYYGVNNDLGHNMSMAGSSWHRAFRNSSYKPGVTDGNDYGAQENGEDVGQYVSDATWVKAFAQAYEGGEHHGDYFILDKDISINATLLPDNFVFTGHLDGRGNEITISNSGKPVYKPATDLSQKLYTKNGDNYTEYSVPNPLYTRVLVPATYYSADEIVEIDGKHYVKETVTDNGDGTYSTKEGSIEKNVGDVKVAEHYDYSVLSDPTLANILNGELYTDENGTRFSNPSALYVFSHTSTSYLFAGLDAKYTTAQEAAADPFAKKADGTPVITWEANVHKEGNYWVPMLGYRAELYNTTVRGGNFFPVDAVFCGGDLNLSDATVTGYIYNCFDASHEAPGNPLTNKVPIPQY